MRHRKHRSKLNRTTEHRRALMRNLTMHLVEHERIHTTLAKAQQLRPYVERLVTLARRGDLPAFRLAFSRVGHRETIQKLFDEIAPRVADRNGGYLRIVKDNPRPGDGTLMAYIEFVDAPAVSEADGEGEGKPSRKTMKQRMHERRKEMAKMRRRGT